jgi:hydrogenase maturation protein HypF
VRGQVQGVGFRPTVWRIAREMGLRGAVRNTGDGVEIRLWGSGAALFADRLLAEAPALARIDAMERAIAPGPAPEDFSIAPSAAGPMRAGVAPDAATCPACLAEIRDPAARRFGHPFANCTDCGPRFAIVQAGPYDRARTTMAAFPMCADCRAEYGDPADRRFHAQPIACPACGPRLWIEPLGEVPPPPGGADPAGAVGALIARGFIVAVKGVGGVHLACDAANPAALDRLRARKRRPTKPLALMARDLDVIRAYAEMGAQERALLESPAAPVVLLRAAGRSLPEAVAPGLTHLGFMLPHAPLHHLMLRDLDRPVAMTSGNVSGQPQCVADDEVRARLAGVADFACLHDRAIANRVDDSVARVTLGRARLIRRSRGYAPAPIPLPPGFDRAAQVAAMGSELKNALCLVKDGQAILSQHVGDLADPATDADADRALALLTALFDHAPQAVAVDLHPDWRGTRRGRRLAAGRLPVIAVQHHHAHIAACLAENGRPLDAPCVLGLALDGFGLGADGTVWGGELLRADYRGFERLGGLEPVALPGGDAAAREPWRNAYAHLAAAMDRDAMAARTRGLPLGARLAALPRATLDAMIARGVNSPLASSCGRLFDAAAAVAGLAWGAQGWEGEAAARFEAAVDPAALREPEVHAHPFSVARSGGLLRLDPSGAWAAMLEDLRRGAPVGVIAARFHRGLACGLVALARQAAREDDDTVALSGGCLQNATLLGLLRDGLEGAGFTVLTHARVPANDGGLALGQAAVALAALQAGAAPAPGR